MELRMFSYMIDEEDIISIPPLSALFVVVRKGAVI